MLALEFGLLPDTKQRRHPAARLSALVHENGYRIGIGFVGTPLICDALCNSGHAEAAYRLLLERQCSSWLYPVTMGATTIRERGVDDFATAQIRDAALAAQLVQYDADLLVRMVSVSSAVRRMKCANRHPIPM